MILPDANVLIYAHDETSWYHHKARKWWESALGGTESVGLPWVVVLAFVRLMTHPQICEKPLAIAQVRELVGEWLAQPHVSLIHVSEMAVTQFFDLLEEAGGGGNLSTDALIALHAMEHSATVFSNDRDFDRFASVRRVNPLW